MGIKFTWDPKKAKRNMQRHGLSFETGTEVFDDPFLLILEDCEDEYGELRYHVIGRAYSDCCSLSCMLTARPKSKTSST